MLVKKAITPGTTRQTFYLPRYPDAPLTQYNKARTARQHPQHNQVKASNTVFHVLRINLPTHPPCELPCCGGAGNPPPPS